MIKLHYAERDNDEDIPEIEFQSLGDLHNFIQPLKTGNRVFVFGYRNPENENSETESIVTSKTEVICDFIARNKFYTNGVPIKFFLFEHPSYDSAYQLALGWKEISQLCYESGTKDSNNEISINWQEFEQIQKRLIKGLKEVLSTARKNGWDE